MKKNKKFYSVRVRFTLTFILVMIISFGVCILLNMYFLESYYQADKKKSMMNSVEEINTVLDRYGYVGNYDLNAGSDSGESSAADESAADGSSTENGSNSDSSASGKSDTSSNGTLDDDQLAALEEDLQEIGDYYWRKDNLNIIVIGSDGTPILASSHDTNELWHRLFGYTTNMAAGSDILYQDDYYQIVVYNDIAAANVKYMDAVGFTDCGCIFVMSLPMESFGESAAISNRFLLFTGLAVCLLAAIYIFYQTKRMTAPVSQLTEIARKMSDADFSVRYKGRDNDEIGVLGTTMNEMAAELEKNISELKAANEQLQKDIEEKIQIDDMRKEFLSNVSHELKTPIAIIMGYAEGLQDCVNDDPESQAFYTNVIMDEAGKMNQMVQKLLSLNRLEFGNNTCELTDFDIGEMIQGLIGSTKILLDQKEGTISYINKASSLYVSGDEFMIEDVIKNYISNACNHLDGEKKILVTTEDSDEGRLRVSVRNTGENIPADSLEKIWIKFYKVDKARTRAYGGSGIGLSIVKAIMDQHECPYGVYNVEDGVVFWFELNKAEPEIEEED